MGIHPHNAIMGPNKMRRENTIQGSNKMNKIFSRQNPQIDGHVDGPLLELTKDTYYLWTVPYLS